MPPLVAQKLFPERHLRVRVVALNLTHGMADEMRDPCRDLSNELGKDIDRFETDRNCLDSNTPLHLG